MCAICLCPYEEGDIRIFSKRCPHAFHKECILEWLVKGHNECPCCRIEMVTKTEIKETSASLIGTERLAQAMAVVNSSEMQEAPPFRGALQRSRLARQMIARAQRRRPNESSGLSGGSMPPQSPNVHWLWSARFNDGQTNTQLSPGLSPGRPSLPSLTESPSTPRRNNGTNNLHNRDWLWATRFTSASSSSNSSSQQPRTINPSRSSDAIMNPHETNQTDSASPEAASALEASMPDTNAGSLFSSTMFHDHWHQRTLSRSRRNRDQMLTLSPTRVHSHWRQNPTANSNAAISPSRIHSRWRQSISNSNRDADLPVTVLPPI